MWWWRWCRGCRAAFRSGSRKPSDASGGRLSSVGTTLAVMFANRIPGPGAHVSCPGVGPWPLRAQRFRSRASGRRGSGRRGSGRLGAPVWSSSARGRPMRMFGSTSTTNPRLSPTGSPPGTPRKGSRIATREHGGSAEWGRIWLNRGVVSRTTPKAEATICPSVLSRRARCGSTSEDLRRAAA